MSPASRSVFACVFLAVGTGFGPAAAAADVPVTPPPAANVAVLDFSANNVSAGEASVVSEFVRAAMVRSGVYPVVDKNNMTRILSEQAFQQTGCTSEDCAVRLGKLLNVHKMVVGEYSVLEGVKFLTAKLVDVETGRIERTGRVKDFTVVNADEAADRLVAQLTGVTPAGMAFGDTVGARPVRPRVPARDRTRFVVGAGFMRGSMHGTADFTGAVNGPFPGAVQPIDTPRDAGVVHLGIRLPVGKPGRFGVGVDVDFAYGNVGGSSNSFRITGFSDSAGRNWAFAGGYGDWVNLATHAVGTVRVRFADFYGGIGYYANTHKLDLRGEYSGSSSGGWDAYPREVGVTGMSLVAGVELLLVRAVSLDLSVRAALSGSAGSKAAYTQLAGPAGSPYGTVVVTMDKPEQLWFAGAVRVSF